jgi:hypothetical protein
VSDQLPPPGIPDDVATHAIAQRQSDGWRINNEARTWERGDPDDDVPDESEPMTLREQAAAGL